MAATFNPCTTSLHPPPTLVRSRETLCTRCHPPCRAASLASTQSCPPTGDDKPKQNETKIESMALCSAAGCFRGPQLSIHLSGGVDQQHRSGRPLGARTPAVAILLLYSLHTFCLTSVVRDTWAYPRIFLFLVADRDDSDASATRNNRAATSSKAPGMPSSPRHIP